MNFHPDLTHAINAVQRDPNDKTLWQNMALMIAAHGTPPVLQQTLGQRQQHVGDGVAILFKALFDADLSVNAGLRGRLIPFADVMPQDALGTVLRFFAGCSQLCQGDPDAGVTVLRQAAAYITENPNSFHTVPHLIKAPAFADMALLAEETEDRISNGDRLDVPPMEMAGEVEPAMADRWIFASCDSRYFDTFSEQFFKVAGALGPIHLHVVNPSEEQQHWMMENTSSDRQFSVEHQTRYLTSPYYASNRFFHLPSVMDRYGSEILMLDIDLEKLTEPEIPLQAMGDADIGYFLMPTVMPWLRHHAAFIRYSNRPQTRQFIDDFSRLLQSTLLGSTWFVDQMSLLNLVNKERVRGNGISIAGLEAGDGFPFSKFVLPAGEDDTKANLRMQAGLSA